MKINTRDMMEVSLFAALTVVGAKVSLNLPYIPASMQLIFCIFAGLILGAKKGMLSLLVYMIMGLVGLPVFTGGAAGPAYIIKPSFGFILGFVVAAYVIGYIREKYNKVFLAVMAGIIVDYIIGLTYMYLIINLYLGKSITVYGVLVAGFFPFIIKDIVGGIAVAIVATAVLSALSKAGLLNPKNKIDNISRKF